VKRRVNNLTIPFPTFSSLNQKPILRKSVVFHFSIKRNLWSRVLFSCFLAEILYPDKQDRTLFYSSLSKGGASDG
jgi:hypothetical protein